MFFIEAAQELADPMTWPKRLALYSYRDSPEEKSLMVGQRIIKPVAVGHISFMHNIEAFAPRHQLNLVLTAIRDIVNRVRENTEAMFTDASIDVWTRIDIALSQENVDKFLLESCKKGLKLLQGNEMMPRYPGTTVEEYSSHTRPYCILTTRQLFVLMHTLLTDTPGFVATRLMKNCQELGLSYEQMLSFLISPAGKNFTRNLVRFFKREVSFTLKPAQFISLSYTSVLSTMREDYRKPQSDPTHFIDPQLIDPLCMLMRGNNTLEDQLNPDVPDKPICPDDAHIGFMNAILRVCDIS